MLRVFSVYLVALGAVECAPKFRILPEHQLPANLLTLPSNATSIRSNIEDAFNCEGRQYGYYADVENDCQLFHVCLPVTYANGRSQTFRWSFICPEETVFNQEIFTCTRSDEAIECADSPRFYNLNANFGEHLNLESQEPAEEVTLVSHIAEDPLNVPEIVSESTEVVRVTQHQDVDKSTVPIIPIYHRRTMKL